MRSVSIYGSVAMNPQIQNCATASNRRRLSGRLLDHIDHGTI
jgi:hypothetical protein